MATEGSDEPPAADASTGDGGPATDKPPWLRREWQPDRDDFEQVREPLRERGLVTVCEEASCPNVDECWSGEGTATFMLMGDTCTRGCGFCDVATGSGEQLDPLEPAKIAGAVDDIGLDYAVLTSVDRDDLPDGGAAHIAQSVRAVREQSGALVECLIPDFQGDESDLATVVDARPTVLAHNVETVERLQQPVRDPRASYAQSLRVLERAKALARERDEDPDAPDRDHRLYTKSSIMLGFGETDDEVEQTLRDLRDAGVDIVTLGQYLRPSEDHLAIEEYVPPERFERLEARADEMGFAFTAAGPFVRSSYRAGELFVEHVVRGDG
jgi:lipoic acid synthetase